MRVCYTVDDSGTVQKLARFENKWSTYATEMHASPSGDGRKIIVASNWNSPSGRPVQVFVLRRP